MKLLVAIALALSLSSAHAADRYFSVYAVSTDASQSSCSGTCPVSADSDGIPAGSTVAQYWPTAAHFQGGVEANFSSDYGAMLKARYRSGPLAFELGAGIKNQRVKATLVPGAPTAKSQAVGPAYSAGVAYQNWALTYTVARANQDFTTHVGATPYHSAARIKSKYLRLEYRVNF